MWIWFVLAMWVSEFLADCRQWIWFELLWTEFWFFFFFLVFDFVEEEGVWISFGDKMGVMSRRVVPACGSLCFFCPSLRARSRQPVKRYKKLLADILPRNQVICYVFHGSLLCLCKYFYGFSMIWKDTELSWHSLLVLWTW